MDTFVRNAFTAHLTVAYGLAMKVLYGTDIGGGGGGGRDRKRVGGGRERGVHYCNSECYHLSKIILIVIGTLNCR